MNRFVCGFLLDEANRNVILIRKRRLSSLWNGVGGPCLKEEETPHAVQRHFQRLTGTTVLAWCHFANWEEWGFQKHYFFARLPHDALRRCQTVSRRRVGEFATDALPPLLPDVRQALDIALAQSEALSPPIQLAFPSEPS